MVLVFDVLLTMLLYVHQVVMIFKSVLTLGCISLILGPLVCRVES